MLRGATDNAPMGMNTDRRELKNMARVPRNLLCGTRSKSMGWTTLCLSLGTVAVLIRVGREAPYRATQSPRAPGL